MDESFAVLSKRKQEKKEEKRKSLRESLGGDTARQPSGEKPIDKTHLLIINGGQHEAFMGDFFGLIHLFEQKTSPSFNGEFWTCEDPEQHMRTFNKQDIKFGGDSIITQIDIVHTRQATSATLYKYINGDKMVDRLRAWLQARYTPDSGNAARSGDSIIIIFLAHGMRKVDDAGRSQPYGILLGEDILTPDHLVNDLRRFPENIQINVLAVSCYSGMFTEKIKIDAPHDRWLLVAALKDQEAWPSIRSPSNRFRNSTFIAGLVRSLGGLSGPVSSPTLQEVKDIVTNATEGHPDVRMRSTPQMFTTATATQVKAAALLFRAAADFPLSPENTAAVRRNELDLTYLNHHRAPVTPPPDGISFAIELVINISRQRDNCSGDYDEGYFESFGVSVSENHRMFLPDVLRGLVWRGRHQSNVFQIFMLLVLHEHCSLASLGTHVDFAGPPPQLVEWIEQALFCFDGMTELLADANSFLKFDEPLIAWLRFHYPHRWLAVMIARSATNLLDVLNFIADSRHLGGVKMAAFNLLGHPPATEGHLKICSTTVRETSFFGCILPHGINVEDAGATFYSLQHEVFANLNKIEQAYDRYFALKGEERTSSEFRPSVDIDIRSWRDVNTYSP